MVFTVLETLRQRLVIVDGGGLLEFLKRFYDLVLIFFVFEVLIEGIEFVLNFRVFFIVV